MRRKPSRPKSRKPASRPTAEEGTAYHEAGHVVAHYFLKRTRRPNRATIVPNEEWGSLGHVEPHFSYHAHLDKDEAALLSRSLLAVLEEVQASLAGTIAEERFTGRRNDAGARVDFENAEYFLDQLLHRRLGRSERARRALFDWLLAETVDFLDDHWSHVEAVAKALLEHETLASRRKIDEVIRAETRRQLIEEEGGDVEKAESLLSIGARGRAKRRAMSPEQRRAHDAYWTQQQRAERAQIRARIEGSARKAPTKKGAVT